MKKTTFYILLPIMVMPMFEQKRHIVNILCSKNSKMIFPFRC